MQYVDGSVYAKKLEGELMTNLDHSVDKTVQARLENHPESYAEYPGWEFHAAVWHEDDLWHAEVNRYHVVVDWISAATPEELMEKVSSKWGKE